MENASKALIMAATVLIGVMLISIGVYLFSIYGEYSSNMYAKMESAQIDQFNAQFLKFYGTRQNNNGQSETILCTIHDIISLANLAKQNNKEQGIENLDGYSEATNYIQIDIGTAKSTSHLEKWDDEKLLDLLKSNATKDVQTVDEYGNTKIIQETKYYICNIAQTSSTTKRVNYLRFVVK